jgi:hypothetical protein
MMSHPAQVILPAATRLWIPTFEFGNVVSDVFMFILHFADCATHLLKKPSLVDSTNTSKLKSPIDASFPHLPLTLGSATTRLDIKRLSLRRMCCCDRVVFDAVD